METCGRYDKGQAHNCLSSNVRSYCMVFTKAIMHLIGIFIQQGNLNTMAPFCVKTSDERLVASPYGI